MFFDVEIEVTLEIERPDDMCADKARYIKSRLDNQYGGTHYNGVFLKEIRELVDVGPCILQRTNNSGKGYVAVRFRARASRLAAGSLLAVQAIHSQGSLIFGASLEPGFPAAAGILAEGAETLRPGLRFVLAVKDCDYPPMKSLATVLGRTLTPAYVRQEAGIFYRLTASAAAGDASPLAKLAAEVEELLESRAALGASNERHRDAARFFETHIYPYSMPPESALESGASVVGIDSGVEGQPLVWRGPAMAGQRAGEEFQFSSPEGNAVSLLRAVRRREFRRGEVWGRPSWLHRSCPLAVRVAGPESLAPEDAVEDRTPEAAFAGFLTEAAEYLRMANDFPEHFPADEREKARGLWEAMKAEQLPPP